ncbi:MAG: DUF1501 domain-containing protein [Planctomycetaceae bacterium]|nr:DUF1501 domain-containing protein [Planctomycetaceae bacterium]
MAELGSKSHATEHLVGVSGAGMTPPTRDLIRVGSRRWFLQAGLAGLGGLTLPQLLHAREQAAASGAGCDRKAVILFWLSGGPSQLDMWDPKPNAPVEVRGPFAPISTALPGVQFSEHLPLQASIADKLSIIRSVDCTASNHTPITLQAGNPLARRTNDGRDGAGYPSMGSIAAKFRGANDPELPAFVGLADSWASDVYGAGHMGSQYEPVKGLELAGKFNLPDGVEVPRLGDRNTLRQQLDGLRRGLDQQQTLDKVDRYTQQAYDMVLSGRVQQAFNLDDETDATRDEYGRVSVGEKALLARRLVESGVTFVLVSGAWGYFDHHGDDVRWGGIEKGLKPLLPRVDRALYALINDLEQRGLLDDTFVMMMGEFGRTPVINEKAGRHHWTNIMSMVVAGGGMPTGQVIGSSDDRGAAIKSGIVRPQDLAATTFKHLGIDLDAHWVNPRGRPNPIVPEGGRPIPELV